MAEPFHYKAGQKYRGVTYPPTKTSSTLQRIDEGIPVFQDKVVVATYPKSGTTWALEIVYQLQHGKAGDDEDRPNLDSVYPFLEFYSGSGKANIDRVLEQDPAIQGIKTHLDASFFSKNLAEPETCPRFLVVMRNPKDVLVSFYHFHRSIKPLQFDRSFDEFFEMYRSKRLLFGCSLDHNASWWALREHPRVLVLNYEDLLQDPRDHIRRIANFLGVAVDDAEVARIQEASSLSTMSQRGVGSYLGKNEGFDQEKGQFFRKGIKGDWRTVLSEEQSQLVDARMQEKCKDGLQFKC